jgi:predicted DNA-binding transcriptional regulator AlpA
MAPVALEVRPQQPSPTPPPSPELLDSAAVAAILGTSTRQVQNMRARGQLPPPVRINGLGLRWTKYDLEVWLAQQVGGEVVTKVMEIGGSPPRSPRPRRARSGYVSRAGLRGEGETP